MQQRGAGGADDASSRITGVCTSSYISQETWRIAREQLLRAHDQYILSADTLERGQEDVEARRRVDHP